MSARLCRFRSAAEKKQVYRSLPITFHLLPITYYLFPPPISLFKGALADAFAVAGGLSLANGVGGDGQAQVAVDALHHPAESGGTAVVARQRVGEIDDVDHFNQVSLSVGPPAAGVWRKADEFLHLLCHGLVNLFVVHLCFHGSLFF